MACTYIQCPSWSTFFLSSHFLVLYKLFYPFFFFLADLEHESFIHVVGNIYVARDLVVSLCFSWWLFTVFISVGLFYWALPFFKSLLCCKADFFFSFLSQLSCFFMDHLLTLQLLESVLNSLLRYTVMGNLWWKQLKEAGFFLPLIEISVNYWLCFSFFFFVLEYYFTVSHFKWWAPCAFCFQSRQKDEL